MKNDKAQEAIPLKSVTRNKIEYTCIKTLKVKHEGTSCMFYDKLSLI